MKGSYDDIIDLPHHISSSRSHMPMPDRAAQFSSFAALTGFDAAVKETARLTDERRELGEDAKADVDNRLSTVRAHLGEQPQVSITYFQPDKRKEGGAYIVATGCVKRFDDYEHVIVMLDGKKIPIDDIVEIDGTLFDFIDDRGVLSD